MLNNKLIRFLIGFFIIPAIGVIVLFLLSLAAKYPILAIATPALLGCSMVGYMFAEERHD